MKYSQRVKESALRKVLPPENRSVPEVSREMGISEQTIYNWKRQAKTGTLSSDVESSPAGLGRIEKFNLLMEGRGKSEEDQGLWLREKGLHSQHLQLWEQELKGIVKENDAKLKSENTQLKKEKKELERELRRKEKALAETAALLTLKKKADAIWGENEDE